MKYITITLLLISSYCRGQTDSALNVACGQITYKYDKFDNQHIWTTSDDYDIKIFKYVKGKDTSYYLSLAAYGETATYGKGVKILFSDGTKMSFPEVKVEPKVNPGGGYSYIYTAFIKISKKQLQTLSKKRVTDFQLYIYEAEFAEVEGEKLKRYAKCLLKKKL